MPRAPNAVAGSCRHVAAWLLAYATLLIYVGVAAALPGMVVQDGHQYGVQQDAGGVPWLTVTSLLHCVLAASVVVVAVVAVGTSTKANSATARACSSLPDQPSISSNPTHQPAGRRPHEELDKVNLKLAAALAAAAVAKKDVKRLREKAEKLHKEAMAEERKRYRSTHLIYCELGWVLRTKTCGVDLAAWAS